MNTIEIKDLKVFAYHGVMPEENIDGQDFYISASLQVDTYTPAKEDELSLSVDYGMVCHFINEYMTANTFKLIETCAHRLAREILKAFPKINKITLELKKPHAPINLPFGCVSVKVTEGYHDVYLSIGSNLGDRASHLEYAIYALNNTEGTKVVKKSSFIETAPVGYIDQPDFLNGALQLRTILTPDELLERIHQIEAEEKREREIHWGPRTLDIDIALYDDLVINTESLCIPHLRMHERDFVLRPLCEIGPNVIHPVLHKSIYMLKNELKA